MRIIERTDEEYREEMNSIYNNEIKPLLNEGFSLTRAFDTVGICTGKYARKAKELRKLALEDGYKMKR